MDQKLSDISAAIIKVLMVSCTECSSEIIDSEFFFCYPESPSFVTYRARLEGTWETDSDFLISLIEDWVRGGGAGIIVTGMLMTVDSTCSVAISSLNEHECSQPTAAPAVSDATSTIAIIAGMATTVVILVAIIIAIILLQRYCHRVKNPDLKYANTLHGRSDSYFLCTDKGLQLEVLLPS